MVLKPLPKHEVYIEAKKKNEEDVKYKSISAVKLGCNRCTDVFYSEGGYNDHLFKKHRVRNVLRNLPTVINKLWSRIPERQPLFEGQEECEICGARYFDKLFYYRHVQKCIKPTVEEYEEKQHDLYVVMERDQNELKSNSKWNNEQEKSCKIVNEEEDDVISPSQPKKPRWSRSKKRNWTTTKRRRRQKSGSCPVPSKRYVKSKVESEDLSKSEDRKEHVEFYANVQVEDKNEETKNDNGKVDVTEIESTPTTITTVSSRHENDTDFEVSKTADTSASCSTEESLPTIRRPKTRYQSRMEKTATENNSVRNENDIENSDENTQQEYTHEGNNPSAEETLKSEISNEDNRGISNEGDRSEITEEDGPIVDIAEATEKKKSSKKKSPRSKLDKITSKSKVDAYMEQRRKNRKVVDENQNDSVNKSEISETNRRMQTRSQSQVESALNENTGDDMKSASEKDDEEEEDYFSCKICLQTFKNHNMFKKHKITCTKIKKKRV